MNPLTKVKQIKQLSELEAEHSVVAEASWHSQYKDSSWIFLGGLPYELTEGDILCVFSQYGEIVNINLVRNRKTGKSKGFCFICYEDQRSTVLAVDNFNGIKIKGRTIRVDHVSSYRPPRASEDVDDMTRELWEKGCGAQTPSSSSSEGSENEALPKQHKQDKQKRSNREKIAGPVKGEERHVEQQSSRPARGHIKKEMEAPGSRKHTKSSERPGEGPEKGEARSELHRPAEAGGGKRKRAGIGREVPAETHILADPRAKSQKFSHLRDHRPCGGSPCTN
uniref:RRM domain-containing protein n=1 Tax=Loxodonta africana TaxID=9785 RepID=G3UMB3_LOXAF